ncbi:hypothetical protein DFH06DRAFT_1477014 [Mycena polygramma]|nr:hypothetical protein DFH06DRAFT_1477014 [Mycena polygramma]
MRLSTLPLVLSIFFVASARVLTSQPLAVRQGLKLRQTQLPTPTNLTNPQRGISYLSQCRAATSGVGQTAIQIDIAGAKSNWEWINIKIQIMTNVILPAYSVVAPDLAPKFSAITQSWINILWASRATAMNTAAYATEFTAQIMPLVADLTGHGLPPILSQEALANFSGMATSLETAARSTSDAFTTLTNSLDAFNTELVRVIKDNPGTVPIILRQESEIARLQAEIATYDTELSALGTAIGATALGSSSGVAGFPQFAPSVLVPGLAALGSDVTAYNALAANLANAKSQLQDALSTQAFGDELTQSMSQQVGSFTSVWNAVINDCTEVADFLVDAGGIVRIFVSPSSPPCVLNSAQPQVLWATLNNVDCLYEAMATGLENYANAIENAGIPSASKRDLGGSANFAATLHADVQALVSDARAKAHAFH